MAEVFTPCSGVFLGRTAPSLLLSVYFGWEHFFSLNPCISLAELLGFKYIFTELIRMYNITRDIRQDGFLPEAYLPKVTCARRRKGSAKELRLFVERIWA